MYSKSFSAGPLGLRAWIWPSTGRFDSIACTLHELMGTTLEQISLRRTLCGFEHRFGHKLGMKSKCQHKLRSRRLYYSCCLYVTAGARPLRRGGCTRMLLYTRTLQNIQEHCYAQKRYRMYKNATRMRRNQYNDNLGEGLPVINNTSYDT